MLYHLLYPLHEYFQIFNIFRYITFRTIYAAITALLLVLFLCPWFIKKTKKMQWGQVIRDDGPESHMTKKGTPSMGGLLMLGSVVASTLLWGDIENFFIWTCLLIFVGFGGIGLLDDLKKVYKGHSAGLPGKWKLAGQALFVIVAAVFLSSHSQWDTQISVPFFKNFRPDIGIIAYAILALLVMLGSSNAVNLTDGLDGLATGPLIAAASVYTLFSYLAGHAVIAKYLQIPYVPGVGELSIFCGAMVGACLGFLWYNAPPASIFMGDVGSLSMGGALGAVAILVKQEILLVIVGGIFVVEALSVIMQVGYFKATRGKRIFRMSPIHHHFELGGVPESKIMVRFWIVAAILGLVAVSTLKLR
jgi:phospho-N-acetylmuramoyl-pentapeptide-transferase